MRYSIRLLLGLIISSILEQSGFMMFQYKTFVL